VDALSLITQTRATSLGAVTLGAVTLRAVTLRAVTLGAVTATRSAAAPAGSDALFQLLQLETDMLHGFSPPFCVGLARLQILILEKDFL
jgi:hypothetical protein